MWRHVPTESNPADVASRGINANDLLAYDLWWHGPNWLLSPSSNWPNLQVKLDKIDLERRFLQSLNVVMSDTTFFQIYSNIHKLIRICAICLRFRNNCKKSNRLVGELTVQEIQLARIALCKVAQMQSFPADALSIQNSKLLANNSKLKNLDPFLDEHGLLRVGGRINKANLNFENKHPIILGSKHPLTTLIILSEHYKQLHAGCQTLLATLRQHYWILNGRNAVRSVLRKCIVCFRVNPKVMVKKMASLPSDRVLENRPFMIVGVDFAGPFQIKNSKLRNRTIIKAYLCVYICFTTKAVHLEVVSDLSTESFLKCFKRFISRRGICKKIYSDNGKNFVGASNELKKMYKNLELLFQDRVVTNFFLENEIEWKFIPPHSPHRGGLWEAAVKRAKLHTVRMVGKLVLTFEDLQTIFTQIEAILNSRPLMPLTNDVNDLSALTPGHFLVGHSLNLIPDTDFTKIPENRLKQFDVLKSTIQSFWKRWSGEYLQNLQLRTKWKNEDDQLKQGTLVILSDENLPPLFWKLGRIVELYPSSDGICRTAKLLTLNGETTRAVQKLAVLPLDC